MSKEIIVKTDRTTNYIYRNDKNSSVPIIFLHGFTGSHRSWDEVFGKLDCAAITLDLPGHGKSIFNDLDVNYSIDDWCEDFNEILDFLGIDKINLCGYSMGGRLAIAFAVKYPQKINKLILESASYGIENEEERGGRLKEDLSLCDLIEKDSPKFVQKWENSPLFSKQKDRNREGFLKQQKERLSPNPKQLSKALKSFSQGKMKFYKDEFLKFKFPVMIINGSEDSQYIKIGNHMKKLCSTAEQYIISDCSHNTHLEKSSQFFNYLNSITLLF